MADIVRLVGPSRRVPKVRGRFSVEVDDLEARALLEGTRIAIAPYSLADWMYREASPLMAASIVENFGDNGTGGIGGTWAPLQESTIRIKAALGVQDPEAANMRTDQMLEAMVTDHLVVEEPLGAVMAIPGDISDPVLHRKLVTARRGWVQGSGDMIPGAVTPARPVNNLVSADVAMLMISLEVHIMNTVAMMLGSSLVPS